MGKNPFSFRRTISRRRNNRRAAAEMMPLTSPAAEMMPLTSAAASAEAVSPMGVSPTADNAIVCGGAGIVAAGKGKRKAGGARLWMRFDRNGQSELIEWDKTDVIKRVSIPARDLRILGPVFSQSSNILAREKAMVVNLEFIKAIVTAEEVLLLDPLCQEVIPFVDQLRKQLPPNSNICGAGIVDVHDNEVHSPNGGKWAISPHPVERVQDELPFEFRVLETALEIVCSFLDSSVVELEKDAYPILDELARNVSTKNLERVRSLKSNLTRLLARVQKVRNEIEHLLDDNEDMAHLYLTRRMIQYQQSELLLGTASSSTIIHVPHYLSRASSYKSGSLVTSNYADYDDVEDLEMLLEAYFMQLDRTRNKILSVREYIDDTEDYVNIQLDNQRNELIQLQLTLTIASFALTLETLVAGLFGMNIQCTLYNVNGIFGYFVWGTTASCSLIFILIVCYARWKKLLGS
ncbi:Magnesium transporter MRS2-4 [Dionaea muscipula]